MTDIATWPFTISSDYQGKGIGFVPTVATVERKTQYGYEFVEDPETNAKGYKRTWSGPRGKWNEDAGRSDPYTGPEFAPGQKVSLFLSQRDTTNKENQPVTYHNINGIRLAEPDAGGSGGPAAQMGVRQPDTAAAAPESATEPLPAAFDRHGNAMRTEGGQPTAAYWVHRDEQITTGMAFNNLTAVIANLKDDPESPEDHFGFLGFGMGWKQAYDIWSKWFSEASRGLPLTPVPIDCACAKCNCPNRSDAGVFVDHLCAPCFDGTSARHNETSGAAEDAEQLDAEADAALREESPLARAAKAMGARDVSDPPDEDVQRMDF